MTVSVVLAVIAGGLYALGCYLITQRSLLRIVFGFILLSHGANLALLTAGGPSGEPPLLPVSAGGSADPLPQAMTLTAIVITFAMTMLLLALAYRSWTVFGNDAVQDDPEDRRIHAEVEDHDDQSGPDGDRR